VSLFSLQLLSETFLILVTTEPEIQRDTITYVHGSAYKVPAIIIRF